MVLVLNQDRLESVQEQSFWNSFQRIEANNLYEIARSCTSRCDDFRRTLERCFHGFLLCNVGTTLSFVRRRLLLPSRASISRSLSHLSSLLISCDYIGKW